MRLLLNTEWDLVAGGVVVVDQKGSVFTISLTDSKEHFDFGCGSVAIHFRGDGKAIVNGYQQLDISPKPKTFYTSHSDFILSFLPLGQGFKYTLEIL